jgi:hypothetical protein
MYSIVRFFQALTCLQAIGINPYARQALNMGQKCGTKCFAPCCRSVVQFHLFSLIENFEVKKAFTSRPTAPLASSRTLVPGGYTNDDTHALFCRVTRWILVQGFVAVTQSLMSATRNSRSTWNCALQTPCLHGFTAMTNSWSELLLFGYCIHVNNQLVPVINHIKRVKLSLQEAVEAHRIVGSRVSYIF